MATSSKRQMVHFNCLPTSEVILEPTKLAAVEDLLSLITGKRSHCQSRTLPYESQGFRTKSIIDPFTNLTK